MKEKQVPSRSILPNVDRHYRELKTHADYFKINNKTFEIIKIIVLLVYMTLPMLPDIELESDSLPNTKEQLLELRQQLHQACKDIEKRLNTIEESETVVSVKSEIERVPMAALMMLDPIDRKEEQILKTIETRLVMEATTPSAVAKTLEQATLEELNSALAKAFAQMAGRMAW